MTALRPLLLALAALPCLAFAAEAPKPAAPTDNAPAAQPAAPATLCEAARQQVGVVTGYDPAYVSIPYPGGDVDPSSGVCTDVVIRALRALGFDLQKAIHEDMRAHFSAYPRN